MTGYERFIALCESRGITQSAAMTQAGLSKALATKWKNQPGITPNGSTLAKLSKFFNVSTDYFIGEEDNPKYTAFNELPDVARLLHAMRNMTEQQRREVIHYAEYICPHAFDTKGD